MSGISSTNINSYIYEDIDDCDIFVTAENIPVERENTVPQETSNEAADLLRQNEELKSRLEAVESEKKLLETRISEVYKTAKAELERKDRRIKELNEEKDNIILRRNNRTHFYNDNRQNYDPHTKFQRHQVPRNEIDQKTRALQCSNVENAGQRIKNIYSTQNTSAHQNTQSNVGQLTSNNHDIVGEEVKKHLSKSIVKNPAQHADRKFTVKEIDIEYEKYSTKLKQKFPHNYKHEGNEVQTESTKCYEVEVKPSNDRSSNLIDKRGGILSNTRKPEEKVPHLDENMKKVDSRGEPKCKTVQKQPDDLQTDVQTESRSNLDKNNTKDNNCRRSRSKSPTRSTTEDASRNGTIRKNPPETLPKSRPSSREGHSQPSEMKDQQRRTSNNDINHKLQSDASAPEKSNLKSGGEKGSQLKNCEQLTDHSHDKTVESVKEHHLLQSNVNNEHLDRLTSETLKSPSESKSATDIIHPVIHKSSTRSRTPPGTPPELRSISRERQMDGKNKFDEKQDKNTKCVKGHKDESSDIGDSSNESKKDSISQCRQDKDPHFQNIEQTSSKSTTSTQRLDQENEKYTAKTLGTEHVENSHNTVTTEPKEKSAHNNRNQGGRLRRESINRYEAYVEPCNRLADYGQLNQIDKFDDKGRTTTSMKKLNEKDSNLNTKKDMINTKSQFDLRYKISKKKTDVLQIHNCIEITSSSEENDYKDSKNRERPKSLTTERYKDGITNPKYKQISDETKFRTRSESMEAETSKNRINLRTPPETPPRSRSSSRERKCKNVLDDERTKSTKNVKGHKVKFSDIRDRSRSKESYKSHVDTTAHQYSEVKDFGQRTPSKRTSETYKKIETEHFEERSAHNHKNQVSNTRRRSTDCYETNVEPRNHSPTLQIAKESHLNTKQDMINEEQTFDPKFKIPKKNVDVLQTDDYIEIITSSDENHFTESKNRARPKSLSKERYKYAITNPKHKQISDKPKFRTRSKSLAGERRNRMNPRTPPGTPPRSRSSSRERRTERRKSPDMGRNKRTRFLSQHTKREDVRDRFKKSDTSNIKRGFRNTRNNRTSSESMDIKMKDIKSDYRSNNRNSNRSSSRERYRKSSEKEPYKRPVFNGKNNDRIREGFHKERDSRRNHSPDYKRAIFEILREHYSHGYDRDTDRSRNFKKTEKDRRKESTIRSRTKRSDNSRELDIWKSIAPELLDYSNEELAMLLDRKKRVLSRCTSEREENNVPLDNLSEPEYGEFTDGEENKEEEMEHQYNQQRNEPKTRTPLTVEEIIPQRLEGNSNKTSKKHDTYTNRHVEERKSDMPMVKKIGLEDYKKRQNVFVAYDKAITDDTSVINSKKHDPDKDAGELSIDSEEDTVPLREPVPQISDSEIPNINLMEPCIRDSIEKSTLDNDTGYCTAIKEVETTSNENQKLHGDVDTNISSTGSSFLHDFCMSDDENCCHDGKNSVCESRPTEPKTPSGGGKINILDITILSPRIPLISPTNTICGNATNKNILDKYFPRDEANHESIEQIQRAIEDSRNMEHCSTIRENGVSPTTRLNTEELKHCLENQTDEDGGGLKPEAELENSKDKEKEDVLISPINKRQRQKLITELFGSPGTPQKPENTPRAVACVKKVKRNLTDESPSCKSKKESPRQRKPAKTRRKPAAPKVSTQKTKPRKTRKNKKVDVSDLDESHSSVDTPTKPEPEDVRTTFAKYSNNPAYLPAIDIPCGEREQEKTTTDINSKTGSDIPSTKKIRSRRCSTRSTMFSQKHKKEEKMKQMKFELLQSESEKSQDSDEENITRKKKGSRFKINMFGKQSDKQKLSKADEKMGTDVACQLKNVDSSTKLESRTVNKKSPSNNKKGKSKTIKVNGTDEEAPKEKCKRTTKKLGKKDQSNEINEQSYSDITNIQKEATTEDDSTSKTKSRRITPLKIGEVTNKRKLDTSDSNRPSKIQKMSVEEPNVSPLPHMEEILKNLQTKNQQETSPPRNSETAIETVQCISSCSIQSSTILHNQLAQVNDASIPIIHLEDSVMMVSWEESLLKKLNAEDLLEHESKSNKFSTNQNEALSFSNILVNTSTPNKNGKISETDAKEEASLQVTSDKPVLPANERNVSTFNNGSTASNVTKSYLAGPFKRDRRRRIQVQIVDIS